MKLSESDQQQIFGDTTANFLAMAANSGFDLTDPKELNRYAMCILSDVQEEINLGSPQNLETARQFVNKAKFFITMSNDAADQI